MRFKKVLSLCWLLISFATILFAQARTPLNQDEKARFVFTPSTGETDDISLRVVASKEILYLGILNKTDSWIEIAEDSMFVYSFSNQVMPIRIGESRVIPPRGLASVRVGGYYGDLIADDFRWGTDESFRRKEFLKAKELSEFLGKSVRFIFRYEIQKNGLPEKRLFDLSLKATDLTKLDFGGPSWGSK